MAMERTTEEILYTWAFHHEKKAHQYRELLCAWRNDLQGGPDQRQHAVDRLATARELVDDGMSVDDATRRAHERHTLGR